MQRKKRHGSRKNKEGRSVVSTVGWMDGWMMHNKIYLNYKNCSCCRCWLECLLSLGVFIVIVSGRKATRKDIFDDHPVAGTGWKSIQEAFQEQHSR